MLSSCLLSEWFLLSNTYCCFFLYIISKDRLCVTGFYSGEKAEVGVLEKSSKTTSE